jgi:hypothetical protein
MSGGIFFNQCRSIDLVVGGRQATIKKTGNLSPEVKLLHLTN